ncbi:hypothetical protein ACS0TY_008436 [Phlomoides rotata]
MASTLLHMLLPTLVFLSTILHFPATATSQECPYPCYPPPIGPGNDPPETTTPPAFTTPPASFSPPLSSSTTPGYFPFTQPPPYFYGAVTSPPEPIISWFPYYFRKPLHQDPSSSTALSGSRITMIIFPIFIVISFVFH